MQNQKETKYLSEGITIGGFTLIAYLVTFFYQMGYATHFDIPIEFITIDLTTMLISFAALIGGATTIVTVTNFIMMNISDSNDPIPRTIRRFAKIFIFIFIGFIPLSSKSNSWIAFLIIISMFAFLEFVFPLITQRNCKTYSEKLAAQDRHEFKLIKKSIYMKLADNFGIWAIDFVLLIIISLPFAYNMGNYIASEKKEFFVLSKNTVVLAICEKFFVTAKYNAKTKVIDTKRKIAHINNNLEFQQEKIGPLILKP